MRVYRNHAPMAAEVCDVAGTILDIEGASFPNWVGNTRELFSEFAGNRLTLMTLPMPLAREQAVGYLTWERVSQAE